MEDFVSFEIAKKLKEKGFREECLAYYTTEYTLYNNMVVLCDDKYLEVAEIDYNECLTSNNSVRENKDNNICDAPTISQVLKWLREEKEFMVFPVYSTNISRWYCSIVNADSLDTYKLSPSDSYEQAALAGIEYCLDNLM